MKKSISNKFLRTFCLFIILITGPSIFTSTLIAQSITVAVSDVIQFEIAERQVNIYLTEITYDYDRSEYLQVKEAEISTEILLDMLSEKQLSGNLVESNTESHNYPDIYTQKKQVRTETLSNYQFIIYDEKNLNHILEIASTYRNNIQVVNRIIKYKNEDNTKKQLVEALLIEANHKANEMAMMLDRKVTDVSNIKLLEPKNGLEKTRMHLEVTFETENL